MLMPTVTYLQVDDCMLQQREQREKKAIEKATEAARDAYENLPM